MIFTLGVFASLLIGLIGWWYYEYYRHMPYLSKYGGPTPIPIFGNVFRIFSNKDVIPLLMEYVQTYGPVIPIWCGYRPRIIISHYKMAELLLESTKLLNKSLDYKFFERWLGTGLLTSTGEKWRKHRKLLTPTFHFQILEQHISIFNKECEVLVNELGKVVDKESFDVKPYINLCVLDIIYESVMGVKINAQQSKGNSEYVKNVYSITTIIVSRMFSVFKSYEPYYKLTSDFKSELKSIFFLHGHTNFVIKSREKEHQTRKVIEADQEDVCGIKRRKAFLDLLLESRDSGAQLTIEDIRQEVETFMFEGQDTTTAGISFALYCLSLNRDIQEKAVEEIQQIINHDTSQTTTYSMLQSMKYLEMVIKESLRLYPPVTIFARELPQDAEFDGQILPKGMNLTMFTFGLHRQEDVFPNPEKFDPERFSAENSAGRSAFAYVPFSAGIRNCIGQRFAMLIMKSVISRILLKFEILPVVGYTPELYQTAVLQTTNGIMIRLIERKL